MWWKLQGYLDQGRDITLLYGDMDRRETILISELLKCIDFNVKKIDFAFKTSQNTLRYRMTHSEVISLEGHFVNAGLHP